MKFFETVKIKNVIIIGAGPAGMATAIQLKRYGIDPLVIEKDKIGGLLKNANLVENYPGFPEGITGINLVKLFEEQIRKLGIKILFEEVTKLDFKNREFVMDTHTQKLYSQMVIIASGTKPKRFTTCNIPAEIRDKIFYEIEPILGIENKKIVIVGAGDISFDYALNLSQNNEVIILNKGNEIKCLPVLWKRVKMSHRISYKNNTKISKIVGTTRRVVPTSDMITLECENSDGNYRLRNELLCVNYIIFAIGRTAQLDYLSENIKKNIHKINNLYFAGDVKNRLFRQVAIATGDGIRVAMKIYKKLKEKY